MEKKFPKFYVYTVQNRHRQSSFSHSFLIVFLLLVMQ